jgi:hypothetical protein
MRALFQAIDDFLRGHGVFAAEAPLAGRLRWLVVLVLTCGPFYGVIMGTYSGRAMTIALLRKTIPESSVDHLWQQARRDPDSNRIVTSGRIQRWRSTP